MRAQDSGKNESRPVDPSSDAVKLALSLYEHNMLSFQSIEELRELEAMGWRFIPPEQSS